MLQIIIKSAVFFAVMVLGARLMGNKLISQMTYFNFVAGITLGSIAGSIITSRHDSLWVGFAGLSVFILLTVLMEWITLKSLFGRKLFVGQPILVIKDGKVLEDNMKKVRLTIDDLTMLLRKKNAFYLDEVEQALFETDGTLSVLKNATNRTVTQADMNIPAPTSRGLPHTIIIEGTIIKKRLHATGKSEHWLHASLQAQGISDLSEVEYAQVDENGQLFVDRRNDGLRVH